MIHSPDGAPPHWQDPTGPKIDQKENNDPFPRCCYTAAARGFLFDRMKPEMEAALSKGLDKTLLTKCAPSYRELSVHFISYNSPALDKHSLQPHIHAALLNACFFFLSFSRFSAFFYLNH